MSEPPIDPALSDPPRPRRSIATWIMLLIVWIVGLVMWSLYLGLAIYILYRIM